MTARLTLTPFLLIFLVSPGPSAEVVQWSELPPLPDEVGLAGMYAGTSHDVLIVAGGANFPDPPAPAVASIVGGITGGNLWATAASVRHAYVTGAYGPLGVDAPKVYHDSIFVLTSSEGKWRKAKAQLPMPLAYGVSVSLENRVICLGGKDASREVSKVFSLEWRDGKVIVDEKWPELPKACADHCGVLLGETIHLAGGTGALHAFWSLDLSQPPRDRRWQALKPWPGRGRFQAIAGEQDGKFHLFGGIELRPDGERARPYLRDAYSYDPGKKTWKKLSDAPHPIAAAPSPAIPLGQSHLLILGGADSTRADIAPPLHPGFPERILAYHTVTDTWSERGRIPLGLSRVTAPVVAWGGGHVIINGERSPRFRSPKVLRIEPAPRTHTFGMINWLVLSVYLASLMGMGFYFSRRGKGTEDFFLAGRRIPWWAAGLSIYGTQLSAITFMAIPATAYVDDWTRSLSNLAILCIAPLVIFVYLPFYRRLNVTSAYEYLERRFDLRMRLLGSMIFILYHLGRMGIILLLPAIALSTVTNMNIYLCIGVMGVVCIIYTVLGGIEAVIWTDVIQVFVLIAGALFCLFLIASRLGGWGELFQQEMLGEKTRVFNWSWSPSETGVWVIFIGALFFNLFPYTADQTVVQRYLTTPDEKQAGRGIWINGILAVPTAVLFFGLGTALFLFFREMPERLTPGRHDAILPEFIVQQMPVGLAGLVIAGLFAAAMSSLDSSMNSIATAGVTDFYRRFKPTVSDDQALRLAKWLTVLVGVFGTGAALFLAAVEIRSLFDHFIRIMGMIGGSVAGAFALGIFTTRARPTGVLVGTLVGAVLPMLVGQWTTLNPFLFGAVGILSCVGVGYGVSLCLKPSDSDLEGLTVWTSRSS